MLVLKLELAQLNNTQAFDRLRHELPFLFEHDRMHHLVDRASTSATQSCQELLEDLTAIGKALRLVVRAELCFDIKVEAILFVAISGRSASRLRDN